MTLYKCGRFYLRPVASIALAAFSLSACDSNAITAVQQATSSRSPFHNQPLSLRTVTAADPNSPELLSNADFSNQFSGWTMCSGSDGVSVVNSTAVVSAGNCVSQGINVSADQDLTLTCTVKRASAGDPWAGVGLSFYDINGNFISEPTAAQVDSTSFAEYTVEGTAPQGAAYASGWVYTETGVTVANCSLKDSGNVQPPVQPPTPPTPPPSSGNELLTNADFTNQLNSWTNCNGNPGLSAQNNTAVLGAQNCFYQSVDVSANQALDLSCQARLQSNSNQWSGIGLSFYDNNWNLISEPDSPQVIGTSFQNYYVSGTAPQGATNALVWAYSESGMVINNCSLTGSDNTTPPPPPEPPTTPTPPSPPSSSNFCPAYVDSSLYRSRGNTIVIGPEQDDWERIIERAPANTEILLKDGEYLLDRGTIFMQNDNITVRSLSQNRDNVVIKGMGFYTGESEGFMLAADRITIADMTMYGMRRHAVAMKPELDGDGNTINNYVYNMNIYDTGTQHVKTSDGGPNINTVIACNKLGYNPGVARGDYNGAVGVFKGQKIHIRDNYIYNITGDGTGCDVAQPEVACIYESAPAIYARESADTIVERNIILESWRGISLGLVEGHTRGIVRNNFIYRSTPGDMGISIERSVDTLVEHNTVFVDGYWAPIEVKEGSGGHIFRNNLTSLPINLRGTSGSSFAGNIDNATINELVAPGDPHLKQGSIAIGAGVPGDLSIDIDGDTRSDRWDVGADQY